MRKCGNGRAQLKCRLNCDLWTAWETWRVPRVYHSSIRNCNVRVCDGDMLIGWICFSDATLRSPAKRCKIYLSFCRIIPGRVYIILHGVCLPYRFTSSNLIRNFPAMQCVRCNSDNERREPETGETAALGNLEYEWFITFAIIMCPGCIDWVRAAECLMDSKTTMCVLNALMRWHADRVGEQLAQRWFQWIQLISYFGSQHQRSKYA